jgi:hypothetical protein
MAEVKSSFTYHCIRDCSDSAAVLCICGNNLRNTTPLPRTVLQQPNPSESAIVILEVQVDITVTALIEG